MSRSRKARHGRGVVALGCEHQSDKFSKRLMNSRLRTDKVLCIKAICDGVQDDVVFGCKDDAMDPYAGKAGDRTLASTKSDQGIVACRQK